MRRPLFTLILLAAATLACGRSAETSPDAPPDQPTAIPPPPPTPTVSVPTLPAEPPTVSDFQAFVAYAEAIKPIVESGAAAAERDGDIAEASREDPSALCGGNLTAHPTLLADAALMESLGTQLDGITPPPEAAGAIHAPLRDSVRLWGEALDNINQSCLTENETRRNALRAGAVLQFWGAALNFRVASDNFWRLLIANGLEELANR